MRPWPESPTIGAASRCRRPLGALVVVVVAAALAGAALAQSSATEGKRVALVIGNGSYRHATVLNNPVNDVRAMARVLRSVGFEVVAAENVELRPMLRAVAEFSARMQRGGVGLFYYSGHAIQVAGKNYLVPIDAELPSDVYVPSDTVDLGHVLLRMDGAENQLNIVVLDACRDNPFARKWPSLGRGASSSRGLAAATAPPGTYVAYATDPDNVASDGQPGGNGVYTGELVRFLTQPGLKIEDVFKRTADAVLRRTNRSQRPWVTTNFTGDFYFVPPLVASRPPEPPRFEGREEARPALGALALSASVPGVEVLVGDRAVWTSREGASYLLSNLPPGAYTVVGRREGYREWRREVRVAANQRTEVLIDIEPLGPPKVARGDDGAEMVLVPAGEFWMGGEDGAADEKPRHRVVLDAFHIDTHEVTNALYRKFMDATGRPAPDYWSDGRFNEPQQPVVGVSWHDAEAYCRWAAKRLPTEAEWEKTARGTDGRKYPWGEQWGASRANSTETGRGRAAPIGSFPGGVSPYGAQDMAGNVWEWVADWYDPDYYGRSPERNPKGPDSGSARVLRGGSWLNDPFSLRAAHRGLSTPDDRYDDVGFRCARGL
jgi:sulfatase modifying factor 1